MTYPENIEEIKKFAEEIKLDVKYLLGEKYEWDMWLPGVQSLPSNIVFNVGGYLALSSVLSLPDNIVFNIGDSLILSSVKSLPSNTIFNVNKKINFSTKHKVKVIWS